MKKTMYRLLSRLLLLASITLSIIAINSINAFANKFTEKAISVKSLPVKKALVKVYGLTLSAQNINLQLMSNGCTTTDFFRLQWQNHQLLVDQIKADHCRRMPHKIWLSFTIPDQQSGFTLLNDFAF